MQAVRRRVDNAVRSTSGHTAVEYAALLAVVAALGLAAVGNVGEKARSVFASVASFWQAGDVQVDDSPE